MALSLRLTQNQPTPRRAMAWFGCMAGLVGVASMFQPTMIVGNSMSPTLKSGKMIWIDRAYYRTHAPQRGEVIVFKYADQVYVKRIYRVGGERIFSLSTGCHDFSPIREGREKEMAVRFGHLPTRLRVREVAVPEGHVFVLGDNYFDSVDSRDLGPIPVDSILGRAMVPADMSFGLSHEIVPPPLDKDQAMRHTRQLLARAH